MHKALVDEIVKSCRQREREGDCMTVPQPTMLEDAVLALALENDQLRAAPSPPPETRAAGVTEDRLIYLIEHHISVWMKVDISVIGAFPTAAHQDARDLARAILALTHNPAAEGGN